MINTGVQKEYVTHIRDYDYETVCGAIGSTFPEEYEIPRENTGTLKDQGYTTACLAAVIAQISEAWYSKQIGEKIEMSEGFILGAFRGELSTSSGLILTQALKLWTTIGTLPKKYFDVLDEMPEIKKIVAKFPEFYEIASKYKLAGFVSLNYGNDEKRDLAIKSALTQYEYGLVAVSDKGFGEPHAVLLTGWNDPKGYYKFKNSYGEKYGDKGFSQITKSKIDKVYLPLFEPITLPFADVKETDWFYNDILKMFFAGFIKGTSETTFEPNKPLTRAEACALFNRMSKEIDNRFDILNKVLEEKYENMH